MPVTRAFPCALASLDPVRSLVASFCRDQGVTEMISGELELAVNEACTNIIRHSGLGQKETFSLSLDKKGKALSITLVDGGRQYDLRHLKTLKDRGELNTRRPRSGMGVYIIRQLIDAVMYHYLPDKQNELKLIKNL